MFIALSDVSTEACWLSSLLHVAAVDGLSLGLGWIGVAGAEFALVFTSFYYAPLANHYGILKQLYRNE